MVYKQPRTAAPQFDSEPGGADCRVPFLASYYARPGRGRQTQNLTRAGIVVRRKHRKHDCGELLFDRVSACRALYKSDFERHESAAHEVSRSGTLPLRKTLKEREALFLLRAQLFG